MSEAKIREKENQVFRVQGFSCAGCAKRFEQNVQQLDGVEEAKVNFGASKLTVVGHVDLQELEKAGSFEKLQIVPEKSKVDMRKKSLWEEHRTTIIAFLFLVAGYALQYTIGENHPVTVGAFIATILIGGFSLFRIGLKNLIHLQFDMKTLMTIAIIGAAIIGEWSEGAVVIILFAISEALEGYSMDKARKSISSLMDISPKTAIVRRNGMEETVSVDEIVLNDRMIVKPGQKIAMDGVIVKGHSSVNQAAITGESLPVEKKQDDEVFAGTLNGEGLLEVQVTKLVDDTTIAKMIHLVEEAQAEKAPSQAFVDVFAKYYTPAIILGAVLVALLPPLVAGASWSEWVYQGLAVLVVGCPCALVISTPVAIVTAIGNAAKQGVLIKGGIHLENAGKLKAIAFDKTGTLTKGIPAVTDYQPFVENQEAVFAKVTALENYSQHPLARAFIRKADEEGVDYRSFKIEDYSSIVGKGIQGRVDGEMYYIGNPALFIDKGLMDQDAALLGQIRQLQSQGKTAMLAGNSSAILALIAVADEVRPVSKRVIAKLKKLGIEKSIMLTGDSEAAANEIGKQVGVSEVAAGLLPEDKLEKMKQLRNQYDRVAMVGDGVNDAPALAAATTGIAMGGVGSDTALETADIALMGDDLEKLPYTISLSRKAMNIIKQNISFAIGIKVVALLLVVPGWLTLWIAIFADLGATLMVTLNALRLLRVKK
ncbi:heavy metal translocating P-type ATPase [Bacillus testis]|uniref:heavy metal translocating P-type ATPase n=1 Tax=Bacillus testis TaxID=1622072 RepID=UPI00067EB79E|nr:heavy metal translocating P-type ATPase [Bacillus testis]